MKIKIIYIIIFVCICTFSNAQILPAFGNSRTGTTGMQFLKIGPDARSSSLGGAVSSSISDPSAVYWNPAGLIKADSSKYTFQFANTSYFVNSQQYWISAIVKAGSYGKAGISLLYNDFGRFVETTEFQPFGTGRTFNANSWALIGSYSRILTDYFSFGINTKWAHEGLAGVSTNNLLFDLGIRYDIGFKDARFAVALSNFGANVTPQGKMELIKISGNDTINSFQNVSVPTVFRLAYSMNLYKKGNNYIMGSIQLNHYTDNNETFSIGAEYHWRKILYLRTGYEFGVDEDGFPAAGFGLRLLSKAGIANIDYGFNNKTRLGNIHRIGITWTMK